LTTLDGIEEVCKIATARERFVREHGETMVLPRILVILRIWVPDGHSQVPLAENFGMRLDQIDSLIGACLEAGFAPEDIYIFIYIFIYIYIYYRGVLSLRIGLRVGGNLSS